MKSKTLAARATEQFIKRKKTVMFVATSNKSMQGIYFTIKISVHTFICIFLVLQEIQQKDTQLDSVNSLSLSVALLHKEWK